MSTQDFIDRLNKGIADSLVNSMFADVVLDMNGRLFPAHRLILSIGSEYFARLFRSSFRESKESLIKIGEPMMKPDDFKVVLDLLYGKKGVISPGVARQLSYFHVLAFDPLSFISGNVVPHKAHEVREFFETLGILYPNGMDRIQLGHLRMYTNDYRYNMPTEPIKRIMPDLSELDDDLIKEIVTLPTYRVYNIVDFYNMIVGLINNGQTNQSLDLLEMMGYDRFPPSLKKIIPKEYIPRMTGPIPNLGKNLTNIEHWRVPYTHQVMIIDVISPDEYEIKVHLMDANGTTLVAYLVEETSYSTQVPVREIKIGDIITGSIFNHRVYPSYKDGIKVILDYDLKL